MLIVQQQTMCACHEQNRTMLTRHQRRHWPSHRGYMATPAAARRLRSEAISASRTRTASSSSSVRVVSVAICARLRSLHTMQTTVKMRNYMRN